jgi:conjugal transfer/type IV secretion protein DotA/TraY
MALNKIMRALVIIMMAFSTLFLVAPNALSEGEASAIDKLSEMVEVNQSGSLISVSELPSIIAARKQEADNTGSIQFSNFDPINNSDNSVISLPLSSDLDSSYQQSPPDSQSIEDMISVLLADEQISSNYAEILSALSTVSPDSGLTGNGITPVTEGSELQGNNNELNNPGVEAQTLSTELLPNYATTPAVQESASGGTDQEGAGSTLNTWMDLGNIDTTSDDDEIRIYSQDENAGVAEAAPSADTTGYDIPAPIKTVTESGETIETAVKIGGDSNVFTLFDGDITLVGGDTPAITPCTTPCSGSDYVVRYTTGAGGDLVENVQGLTTAEALAVYGVISSTNGVVSDDARDFYAGSSGADVALASIIAGDVVRDNGGGNVAGDLTRANTLNLAIMAEGIVSGAGSDYLKALADKDVDALPELRYKIMSESAAEFIAAGYSESAAFEMAQEYVNTTYDSIMLGGVDSAGIFAGSGLENQYGSIDTDFYGNQNEGQLIADYLFASDELLLANNKWFPGAFDSDGNLITPSLENYAYGSAAQIQITNGLASAGEVTLSGTAQAIENSGFILPIAAPAPVPQAGFSGLSISSPNMTGGVATPTTMNSGTDSGNWTDDIRLPRTDLIFITMERLLGGVITSIYNMMFEGSTGEFREGANAEELRVEATSTVTLKAINMIIFAVLIGAGLLFFYMFFFGLWKSTQDGEIMGKDWNAFWVPFRSLSGFILINPIPSLGGMTAGMVFIVMLVLGGTALASTAASYIFEKMIHAPAITPVITQDEDFVSGVAKAYACMAVLNSEGILGSEVTANWPYVTKMNALQGVIEGATPVSPKNVDSVWNSFFPKKAGDPLSVDPINTKALKNGYIGQLYQQTGINPFLHGITRYRFGKARECGEFYIPTKEEDIGTAETSVTYYDAVTKARVELGTNAIEIIRSWKPQLISAGSRSGQADEQAGSEANGSNEYAKGLGDDLSDVAAMNKLISDGHQNWIAAIQVAKSNGIQVAMDDLLPKIKSLTERRYAPRSSRVAAVVEGDENEPEGESEGRQTVFVNDYEYAAGLTTLQMEFYTKLGEGVNQALIENNDISTEAPMTAVDSLGWPILGSMFWYIDQRQTAIQGFYTFEFPNNKGSDLRDVDKSEEAIIITGKANSVIDASIGSTGLRFAKEMLDSTSEGSSSNDVGSAVSFAVSNVLIGGEWFAGANNLNISPIERVRHLGVSISNSAILAATVISVIKANSKAFMAAAKTTPYVGTVIAFGGGWVYSMATDFGLLLKSVMAPLLKVAFICANIIPAMPYAMMMIAVIGYMIYVVEALLGVNFFLMTFGHPDGHELYGKGGPGITAMMTLFLRPLLIVIGFSVGIGLNWSLGHLINITILPAAIVQNSGGSFLGNLSEFAGTMVVFTFLHIFLAYKSFSLSWELPNAVLRWGGYQDHADMGEGDAKQRIEKTGDVAGDSLKKAPTKQ